ncbi:motility associated factor glycosyltransferase family protein [Ornithinibacillus salinisoli]|uniref:Motility associated factor glycosyltransferase family protein n=1 Tax=Ornithinibacillus salinisoli TaxID=1848459 RepID=A0ABW4W026_9BACI
MLIDNTLLLKERFPNVSKYYLNHENELQTHKIDVLDSKSGHKTIRFINDNKGLMVHSGYNPLREAERIISSHQDKVKEHTHVFFYGIGMGYHIEKFIEMFPNNSFSIYEPIPEIFSSMSQHRLLSSIITNHTRNLYIDSPFNNTTEYLEEFNINNSIHLIILPSYENLISDKISKFRYDIKKVIQNRRRSLATSAKFQKRWVLNSLHNFSEVLDTPNILTDIERNNFKGKPVVIVSAGPSLEMDLEHIRHIKEKKLAYIFSVGSAINSLIAHDIIPDAICTYDPSELNYEVFKKLIDSNIDHIPMLFGSSVGYETLTTYKGPKVHFITSQDRTSIYFLEDQLNINKDLILDSPSIAIMTFQILNKLGADPIIFAGQNLGYMNGRLYSKGIEYEHVDSTLDEEKLGNAIIIQDVYGNAIKTSKSFSRMRIILEKYAEYYNGESTFINTTKGGAAIKGIPFQPIEEVIEKYLTAPLSKELWWKKQNGYNKRGIEKHYLNLKSSREEYYDVINNITRIMKSISINIKVKNKQNLNINLSQFDLLYNRLMKNVYYKNFLSFYIRVHVEIVTNEIKRLNHKKDQFIIGKELLNVFSGFLKKCKHGDSELEKILNEIKLFSDN